MLVELSPELEKLIGNKVQSGQYSSPTDVVRNALRLLEQRDEIRRQIEEGWQSAQRGEFVDGPEVFDRLDSELEALEQSAIK